MSTTHRVVGARNLIGVRTAAAALVAFTSLVTAACVPPTNDANRLASLTGPAHGSTSFGGSCPAGQNFPVEMDLQVQGSAGSSSLRVQVCAVATTAMGGAPARGSWELTAADGTLHGTLAGSWTWSYDDILRATLQITGGTGSLSDVGGAFELTAPMQRVDPNAVIGGALGLPG